MKGVSYITDESNKRKSVILDLKIIEDDAEKIHDLIDVLIAESRKNDAAIDWEKAKKQLSQTKSE